MMDISRNLIGLEKADPADVAGLLRRASLPSMLSAAEALTLQGHGALVTYSRKVFVPLTRLCRDVCHYCTFATTPSRSGSAFLTIDEVLAIVNAGAAAGCREALFTLGDRPEDRYAASRSALEAMGYASTLEYLKVAAERVLAETGLLPHLNPGLMGDADYAALRPVSASMGLMLETSADRLSKPGGPHYGSPDKVPSRRLESIAAAGRAAVPFTTGLLIGIGETRDERVEALLAIRTLHAQYGHIQEVIVQNFRAKPGTRMAAHPEPPLEEHLWTIAAARLIFGPTMSIQAPPNLQDRTEFAALLRAGVNDWGGVSPVTPDHVNPEAPWPHIADLAAATAAAGRQLGERFAIGPAYAREPDKWLAPDVATKVRRAADARGLPVVDGWHAGKGGPMPLDLAARRSADGDRIEAIKAWNAALANPPIVPEWPNSRRWREAGLPAAGGIASARGLARLYAELVGNDSQLISRPVLEQATRERVAGIDQTLSGVNRYAAGFSLNVGTMGSNPASFGHAGFGGSIAFADPARRIGVGYTTNRMLNPDWQAIDPRLVVLLREFYAAEARCR